MIEEYRERRSARKTGQSQSRHPLGRLVHEAQGVVVASALASAFAITVAYAIYLGFVLIPATNAVSRIVR